MRRISMKKAVFAVMLSLVLVLTMVGTTSAVTNGVPDGSGHPYVGLMVADDASGAPLWRCTGTLISPTIFLTAGHCTEAPAARATIWFEADIQSQAKALGYPYGGATSVDGTVYTHPDFVSTQFYMHDLGVVFLDTPVYMDTLARCRPWVCLMLTRRPAAWIN
jgi:V8-like Glu-specific endopeptidase